METDQNLVSDTELSTVNLVSLDQLCLEKIVSYLDFDSILSLLLTCKKLSSLLSYLPITTWNNSVLYRKGIYLLHGIVFSDAHDEQLMTNVTELMTKVRDQSLPLSSITPLRIIQTWNTFGPVLGKLQSFVIMH